MVCLFLAFIEKKTELKPSFVATLLFNEWKHVKTLSRILLLFFNLLYYYSLGCIQDYLFTCFFLIIVTIVICQTNLNQYSVYSQE